MAVRDRKETEHATATCVAQGPVRHNVTKDYLKLRIIDDYIWLSKTGSLQLFGNKHDFPRWVEYGVVYTPPADLMTGHSRKDIHLVDRE